MLLSQKIFLPNTKNFLQDSLSLFIIIMLIFTLLNQQDLFNSKVFSVHSLTIYKYQFFNNLQKKKRKIKTNVKNIDLFYTGTNLILLTKIIMMIITINNKFMGKIINNDRIMSLEVSYIIIKLIRLLNFVS